MSYQIVDEQTRFGHRKVLPCREGHFCPEGTGKLVPCPPGTYCNGSNVIPTPCEPGTYNLDSLQASCKSCPGGFVCEMGGIVDYANGSYYATCADGGCQRFQTMHGSTDEERVSHEGSRNMVQDAAGNVFIAGVSYGTLDPDETNKGGSDVFVMKYNADGKRLWVKNLQENGEKDDVADDIAIGDDGNIFVAMRKGRSTRNILNMPGDVPIEMRCAGESDGRMEGRTGERWRGGGALWQERTEHADR